LPPISGVEQIKRHLMRLAETYNRILTVEAVRGYIEALDDFTPDELDLAFREAYRRCKFFPNPAEIRECLSVALERMPRTRIADENCKDCEGMGWKVIEKKDRKFAVQCNCRRKAG
jgi:hypothetical protein